MASRAIPQFTPQQAQALLDFLANPGGGGPVEDGSIALAKLAYIASARFLGRVSASSGAVESLNATQVRQLLSIDQVSNTADADKPVSSAVAAALMEKADVDAVVAALLAKANTEDPQTSGTWEHSGGTVQPPAAIVSGAIQLPGGRQQGSYSADQDLTVAGPLTDGAIAGPVELENENTETAIVMTITGDPWVDDNTGAAIGSFEIPAESFLEIVLRRVGGATRVYGLPVAGGGASDTAAQIRDKLMTLLGADRLPASAIHNLPASASFALVSVSHNGDPETGPVVGDTLTATPATGWTVPGQWHRAGAPIDGATGLTFQTTETGSHDYRVALGAVSYVSNALAVGAASGGGGAMSEVQRNVQLADYVQSINCALPNPVTEGNGVIVMLLFGSSGLVVSPPSGFAHLGTTTDPNGSGQSAQVFRATGITGEPQSFSFSWTNGTDPVNDAVLAVTIESPNIGALDVLTPIEGGWANSAADHTINFTAAEAGSLAVVVRNGGAEVTATGSAPLSAVSGAAAFRHGFSGIYPDAGPNAATWTYSANSQSFHAAAIFSPAAP